MSATKRFQRVARPGSSNEPRDFHGRLPQPRALVKWCACTLLLLLPGSLLVLPLLWFFQRWAFTNAAEPARCSIICKRSVTNL